MDPSPPYKQLPSISNISLRAMPSDPDARRPTVHYPEDLVPPGPAPSYHLREDPVEMYSRTSSIAGTDDDDDNDDYDWSGEDDLEDQEAKFKERMGVRSEKRKWGFKRLLTLLFSSLIGSTFLAAVLVTPGIIIHFYWYRKSPTSSRLYIKQNVQAWLFWAAANILLSWYLALFVDLVPVIVTYFISGVWGHVSEQVRSKVELYNTVKDTVKPVLYAASGWASWVIIFAGIFDLFNSNDPSASRASYTHRLSETVEFFFFVALVICIQHMLSHAIAFAFHRTAYKDRIDEVNNALSVIEILRDYRPKTSRASRIPVFGALSLGSLGFGGGNHAPSRAATSPMPEKEQASLLSAALTRHQKKQSQATTKDEHDSGADGDNEDAEFGSDGDRIVGKNTHDKKCSSYSATTKGKSREGTLPIPTTVPVIGSPVSENDSHPSTPSGLRNALANAGLSYQSEHGSPLGPHAHDMQHRYPPAPLHSATSSHHGTPGGTPRSTPRGSIDSPAGAAVEAVETVAKVIKTAVLHDARNIRGKDADTGLSGMVWDVSSSREAKRLAKAIYTRFKDRHRNYLLPCDFIPAFSTPQDAEEAFRVFDKDNNGDISRTEVKATLLRVYKERRSLSRSMRDVSVALRMLDRLLLVLAGVILVFIGMSVFGVEVGSSLGSVYSIGIAASFVFKNAASQGFDAIMFLFVTHPYDTGDRCFIDDENLVVKKMGLFATVFTRSDGTETYYFNSQLFTKFITNVRRSGKMIENLTMHVAWRTPLAKLDALEKCLNDWLATEENRWFEPSTSVTLQHIQYQRYLEITLGIGHNGTWQCDWGLRNARKTAFHAAVQYYCRQLGIVCYESPLPIVFTDERSWVGDGVKEAGIEQGYGVDKGSDMQRSVREVGGSAGDVRQEDGERENKGPRPVLGFMPPVAAQVSHLRARKSKSRKVMLRGIADG